MKAASQALQQELIARKRAEQAAEHSRELLQSFMEHTPAAVARLLLCTRLVLLMQAEFICLETELARAKNSINAAIKNVVDCCIAVSFSGCVASCSCPG